MLPDLGHPYVVGVSTASSFARTSSIALTHLVLRITLREAEAKESWREMDEERQEAVRKGPFAAYGYGAGELVSSADKIIKVRRLLRSQVRACTR